jgi:hypothetical protein
MTSALCVIAPLLLGTSAGHAAGDPAAGQKVFVRCAACHSTAPATNKSGPSLAGVVGRKSGMERGFNYTLPDWVQSRINHGNIVTAGRAETAYAQWNTESLRRTDEHTSVVYVGLTLARSLGSGLLVLIAAWVVAKPGSSPRVFAWT